jgi:RHS repeat-associated protein
VKLLWRDDTDGKQTCYAYDGLNRVTQKVYFQNNDANGSSGKCSQIQNVNLLASTPAVSYTYDQAVPNGKGRLYQEQNSNATNTYSSYDPMGRVTASSQFAFATYNFSYTYNLAGSLISETYPSGRKLTYQYDGANRVQSLSGTLNGAVTNYGSQISYAPHGDLAQLVFGNNVWRTFGYNNRLQLASMQDAINNSESQVLLAQSLGWGPTNSNGQCVTGGTTNNGNLQCVTANNGGPGFPHFLPFIQTFGYDNLNRLASASDTGGWSRTFKYDQYGNMWVTNPTGIMLSSLTPTSINAYNSQNNQLKANAATAYDPFGNGNQIISGVNNLTYDAEHRQIAVSNTSPGMQATYLYDGDGKRVVEYINGARTTFVYDAMGALAAEYDGFSPSSVPCTTCYLSTDHLGSTRLVTDQNANVVARHDYLPFGEEIQGNTAGRTAAWGTVDLVKLKFTGKERDSESGLDNFGARYLGSSLGRFMSPDPLGGRLVDPQTLNRYAYVRNNPLSLTDPTGLYVVNCTAGSAKDQKNCNKGADRFEKQRQKDLKSKDVKVRDAAKAWGNRGEDNHVNVTFKSQQQVDADANTQPGYKTDAIVTPGTTSDHQPNINAEFSEDLGGKDLGQTIAHEGSHIEDNMNFLKSYDPATGQYFGGLNFTHFDTEFQAFEAGSMVKPYTMFPRGPSGYQQLTNYIYRAYPNAEQLVFPPSLYPQGNPPR